MRENEYVIAIFAERGVLHAQTLRFADEVRSVDGLDLPAEKQASAALVKTFVQAIDRHTKKTLDTRELGDAQNAALREHLEHKRKQGKDVIDAEESVVSAAPHAEVIDLMEVLKRSLRGEETGTQPPARSPRARSHDPRRPAKVQPSQPKRQRKHGAG